MNSNDLRTCDTLQQLYVIPLPTLTILDTPTLNSMKRLRVRVWTYHSQLQPLRWDIDVNQSRCFYWSLFLKGNDIAYFLEQQGSQALDGNARSHKCHGINLHTVSYDAKCSCTWYLAACQADIRGTIPVQRWAVGERRSWFRGLKRSLD